MKRFTQTVIPIVVAVGLVFLITFLTQHKPPDPNAPAPAPPGQKAHNNSPATVAFLTFPDTLILTPVDIELGTEGHYDFWFQNPNDTSIEVGINSQSCTCTSVHIGVIGPEGFENKDDAKAFDQYAPAATASRILWGGTSALESFTMDTAIALKTSEVLNKQLRWVKLRDKTHFTGATVPAHSVGVVRMNWESPKKGSPAKRLSAGWCLSPGGDAVVSGKLELTTKTLMTLVAIPNQLQFKDMKPGETRTDQFYCWSPLRDHFDLDVKEVKDDACIDLKCVKLNPDQCRELQTYLGPRFEPEQYSATRVKCGYKIQVTVHENRGPGVHLDLGQFSRSIQIVSSILDEPMQAKIVGEVKGGVEIHTDKGTGRIDFKSYRLNYGTTESAWILTDRPNVEFELDRVEPEHLAKALAIKLASSPEDAGRATRRDMTVRILPGQSSLPEQSAIYLRIKGDEIRRIRIPIHGTGYMTTGGRQASASGRGPSIP